MKFWVLFVVMLAFGLACGQEIDFAKRACTGVLPGVLSQTSISGTGITTQNFTVASNATFIVQIRDISGNDICSNIAAINFTVVPNVTLYIAYIGNGQYLAEINTTTAGDYYLTIYLDPNVTSIANINYQLLSGSPFHFRYAGDELDIPTTIAAINGPGWLGPVTVGLTHSFNVTLLDQYGNAATTSSNVTVQFYEGGITPITVNMTYFGSSVWGASYYTTQ